MKMILAVVGLNECCEGLEGAVRPISLEMQEFSIVLWQMLMEWYCPFYGGYGCQSDHLLQL